MDKLLLIFFFFIWLVVSHSILSGELKFKHFGCHIFPQNEGSFLRHCLLIWLDNIFPIHIIVAMDTELLTYQRTVLRLRDDEIDNLTVAERLTINDQFLRARAGRVVSAMIIWLVAMIHYLDIWWF